MVERVYGEKDFDHAKKIAFGYLEKATVMAEARGLRTVLGIDDDLGPLLFSTCAIKMIEYDIAEKVAKLGYEPRPGMAALSRVQMLNPKLRFERDIWMLDAAAGILDDSNAGYIQNTFPPEDPPPQITHIPQAVDELFGILYQQMTNPRPLLATQERVGMWGAMWRVRLNPRIQ